MKNYNYINTEKCFDLNQEEIDTIINSWQDYSIENKKLSNVFTTMAAPPNITGDLHIGHSLNYTIQDVIVRYQMLLNKKVEWIPGLDHAGISAQYIVKKKYNLSSDEEFLQHIGGWIEDHSKSIKSQIKKMGFLLNWDREYYTLSNSFSKAVIRAFVELYNASLIYESHMIVNWDTKMKTAISDLEVVYKEEDSTMYYFQYKSVDGSFSLEVATTRPETIFADVALAINPKDTRYSDYIGQMVFVPIINKKIPIITSLSVDPGFGAGVMKVTPAHSFEDWEIGKINKLEAVSIISSDGFLMGDIVPEEYKLSVKKAREEVGKKANRTVTIKSRVPYGEKSNTVIEPMVKKQWFFNCKELAEKAIKNLENETKLIPQYWKANITGWVENMKDWCVSRQIVWGHRIPVYRDKNNIYVAETLQEAEKQAGHSNLTQDSDVLDTWFSAALIPLAAQSWPIEDPEVTTKVIVSGYDILNFWILRMMIMAQFFKKKPAFENILIHRLIRDEHGKKMSKTTGNVLDPITLGEKHGIDALRCSLIFESHVYHDLRFTEQKVTDMKKFITKLWNASVYMKNFVLVQSNTINCGQDPFAHYLVNTTLKLLQTYKNHMDQYEITEAFKLVYQFVWDNLCRWFIEIHKFHKNKDYACILLWSWKQVLKLLHPFCPFVTEKIWKNFSEKSLLHDVLDFSFLNIKYNEKLSESVNLFFQFVAKLRRISRLLSINDLSIDTDHPAMKELLKKDKDIIRAITKSSERAMGGSFFVTVAGIKWKIESADISVEKIQNQRQLLRMKILQKGKDFVSESDLAQLDEILTGLNLL